MSASGIRHAVLQKKLDYLDEAITTLETLEREKGAAEDDDLYGDIEEAKEVLQRAREAYSRGDLQEAWLLAEGTDLRVSVFGRRELGSWNSMIAEIIRMTNRD